MKKTIFMMAAVAFMSIGCTKENIEDNTQQTEQKVITFSAGDESVKSVLDGKSVKWASGDHIAIYDGTNSAHMFAYSADYKFTYTSDKYSTGTLDLSQAVPFYAVYPYLNDSGKKTDVFKLTEGGATLTTFLASRQMPKPNTFAAAANISACIPTVDAEEGELNGVMKNLCGYIKFSIESADNIAYVKFTSNSNRKMSGRCDVIFDNETGDVIIDGLECQYVYCSSEAGGAMAAGTYYVAVVPEEHAAGINIMVTTVDGKVYEYNTGRNIKVVANQVLNFGAVDAKMSEGATDKISVLLDFVGRNTNITDKTANYDGELVLTLRNYAVKVTRLYANTSGLATWNPSQKGCVVTPAIEGMVLKNIVVTFRGHTSNSRAYLRLWTINNGVADKKYSGVYSCVHNPTGLYQSRYALPTMNSKYALRVSHVMEPNKASSGQDQGSPAADAPAVAANTSYMLMNESSGASWVESIEFLYEPASAE